MKRHLLVVTIVLFLLAGCTATLGAGSAPTSTSTPPPAVPTHTPTPWPSATPLPSPTPFPDLKIFIAPNIPPALIEQIKLAPQASYVTDPAQANLRLTGARDVWNSATWIYALAAPFPTVLDGVSLKELQAAWRGQGAKVLGDRPLWMTVETLATFSAQWGAPAETAVAVFPADELLERAWDAGTAWVILPFEALEPRWKVLRVDGQSPYDQAFAPRQYPLTVYYGLYGEEAFMTALKELPTLPVELPATNRREDKFTALILTGTTALVRHTALRMEEEGVLYPAVQIGDYLRSADLLHISNEVSFDSNCPPAKPLYTGARFCSAPAYWELLDSLEVDLIELTGNHMLDWKSPPFLATLDLYREQGVPYYGGGIDLTEARRPLLLEHHSNRLAFVGCNAAGPAMVLADGDRPGAAACEDLAWLAAQVSDLKSQGYLVVVTFQAIEVDDYAPSSAQTVNFGRIAALGPVIVSGSQSHFPQGMAFHEATFIHYGLGNLFFDQMDRDHRRAFIDRHIFYDGRYLGVELATTMMEDYAQPRWMTPVERAKLLGFAFAASDWKNAIAPR
ncbi:MAG TPA: CapA family protein [Anaerolineaceae bacterium]|nr:CapA family protein [Anaerolineaceae bacterium]